ncbi:MAG: FAD-dependent oxidoreductase [Actinomycetota bacterium]|nr:FAD-dependent oxidoreductase [Actinomycetota bacterium]
MYFSNSEKEKIIVIGGNVSGLAAASQARRNASNAHITVLESGEYISYGTCALPYFISGIVNDFNKMFAYSIDFFEKERRIQILLENKVVGLNPQKRQIFTQTVGSNELKMIGYDKLVICSGSIPIDLQVSGLKAENSFYLRNIKNALDIKNYINNNNPKTATVIGGGSIGILAAEALSKIGIKVTVIEKDQNIFNDFENEISSILYKMVVLEGIEILNNSSLLCVSKNDNNVIKSISIKNKEKTENVVTDLVMLCTGINANTDFVKGTSIELGKNKAIKTTQKLQTAYSNIFAAGDCCCVKNIVTGKYDFIPTANNAAKTGRIAGENITGGNYVFPGSVGTKSDKVFGLEIAKTGISLKDAMDMQFNAVKITGSYDSHAKAIPGIDAITVTLIVDFRSRKILGAQMIGKEGVAKRIDTFATAITANMTIDDVYMLDLSYSPGTSTVWDPVNKICGKAILELSKIRF